MKLLVFFVDVLPRAMRIVVVPPRKFLEGASSVVRVLVALGGGGVVDRRGDALRVAEVVKRCGFRRLLVVQLLELDHRQFFLVGLFRLPGVRSKRNRILCAQVAAEVAFLHVGAFLSPGVVEADSFGDDVLPDVIV